MFEVRPRHLLLLLAGLAFSLATGVALVARRLSEAAFPSTLPMAVIGIGFGWVGLSAVYLAFGRQRLTIRLAVSVVAALTGGAVCAWGEWNRRPNPDYGNWCGVMLFNLFVIAVPLIYLWARGTRITHPEHPPLVFWRPRGQFSLWDILSTITYTAVLLALAVKLRFPIRSLYAVLAIGGSIGAITYTAGGTLLSRIRLQWAVPAVLVVAGVTGAWLDSIDAKAPEIGLAATLVAAAVIAAWMFVMRIAGYYLHWPDYTATETVGPSKRLVDEQGRPVEIAAEVKPQ